MIRSFCLKIIIILVSIICLVPTAYPQSSQPVKTILILNSYDEGSSWAMSMMTPITYHIAHKDDVRVDLINLNSMLITDSITYDKVYSNALKGYGDNSVQYIVFIGNPALTLRDEVRSKWGDIPMLLITRDLTLSDDVAYYFSGFDNEATKGHVGKVTDLVPEYNLTTIYVPDFYKETIDLMIRLMPQMERLVFFSDAIYFNRHLANSVENYLIAEYPEVTFEWAQATEANADVLQSYLFNPKPNVGLLLASWLYEQMGALGYPTLVSGDLILLSSSVNPIFSLRDSFLSLGSVGGVYYDNDRVRQVIISDIDAMLSGQQMRDINFFIDNTHGVPTIDYPCLEAFGLSLANCPDDTVFVDKPRSFWDKYLWYVIVAILLVSSVISFLARRNINQRHQIETLQNHKRFVDYMPIPYTKAKVVYDDHLNIVVDIIYTVSNQAFEDILRENAVPSTPYILFTPDFISDKTNEMINSGKPVSFMHYLPKADKYYIFTLCKVDYPKRKSQDNVETIDIFAVDVTKREKAELELKNITQRLDTTFSAADMIPWDWNMETDVMTFDAYSLFQRVPRTFEEGYQDQTSRITVADYMRLMHPDDREILRSLRESLVLGQTTKFNCQYRVIVVRQNHEVVEWVEIKGDVVKCDANGRPTLLMGAMSLITDRKKQEADLIEARRQSVEAIGLKSDFINSLSHEVRIQLNAIVGFATLMSETNEERKRHEFADIIIKNNNELLAYIDRLAGQTGLIPAASADDQGREADTARVDNVHVPAQTMAQSTSIDTVGLTSSARPEPVVKTAPEAMSVVKPGGRTSKSANKKLILVAEDIEGNFLLLKHFIPKDYEIMHAWTGKEAVDMFDMRHPDMVLMDIGMPVMDGYKATSEIRKVDTDVPIVAVTAFTYASDREMILSSGFDDYISKPVAREVLIDTLRRYL